MSGSPRQGRGDWVSLIDGVRVSRAWMTRHTPSLLVAWRDAPTAEERRAVAARIVQAAADLESEPSDDGAQVPFDRAWWEVAERIDPRLVDGPDWPPLAAAVIRAEAAGYDVNSRLPALAAAAPLPDRHPARELHWRLLDDCPAALPVSSGDADSAAPAHGLPPAHSSTGRPQIRRDRPPGCPGRRSLGPNHTTCEGEQS